MKKRNNNRNENKLDSSSVKRCFKSSVCAALVVAILCGCVGASAYSAGADDTAKALGAVNEAETSAKSSSGSLSKPSKDETVYVIADASGTTQKIIVSDWIKNTSGSDKISDVSNLENVENVKGDETYTVNEDNVFEWDADGNDIYYRGTGTAELPVKLSVGYKLDGKTISPDELAGKSGRVTIRIDYENTACEKVKVDGEEYKVNVPFLMLSGMILDGDKFSNVEVSNGKTINDGSRTIVAGFALPGMQESLDINEDEFEIPDYVEISADATDFELSTILTLAMNDIFSEVDLTETEDTVDDLKTSLDELDEAAQELADGSSELYDGIETLLDSSDTLVDGVTELYDGASQVSDGASQLNDGAYDLSDGTSQLNDGACDLSDGASQLDSGVASLAEGADSLDSGAVSLNTYVSSLASGLSTLSENSSSLNSGAKQVFDTLLSAADAQISAAGLSADKLTISNYSKVLTSLISSLSDENAQTLAYNTALETVTATVNGQKDVIKTAVEATVRKSVTESVLSASGISMTYDEYDAAVAAGQISDEVQAKISTAVSTQMNSSSVQETIDQNTEAQIQSLIESNMNGDEVQSQISQGVQTAASGRKSLESLKTQLDSYNTFYNGVLSYTSGVDKASAGAQQILSGTNTLKNGTSSLASGASKLKNGSSDLKSGASELKDGMSSLNNGAETLKNGASSLAGGAQSLFEGVGTLKSRVPSLVDGITQLDSGAAQLSDGMKEFKEEGIDVLIDAANGDINDLIDRFKAVKKASESYKSYSGISDDMEGSVKFIYKTDSIEKE